MSPAVSEGRQPSAALIRRLRKDRDRHVAFAFAAADLLIEVGSDDIVVAAAGASHAVLGIDLDDLIGRPIVDFVTTPDQPLARRLLKHVATQYRLDPALIRLARADGTANGVLLGLCRLPDRGDAKFLSMALVPEALAPIARPRDEATGLLTSDSLHAAAQRLTQDDAAGAQQLQLVRLDGLSGAARQLPIDQAAMLLQEVGAALRAASVGDVAGRLGDDAFGLVTKVGRDSNSDAVLAAELAGAIREAGIADGQIQSSVAGIDLPVGSLSNTDVGQALT
jgi:GGDEF domain-containing protein